MDSDTEQSANLPPQGLTKEQSRQAKIEFKEMATLLDGVLLLSALRAEITDQVEAAKEVRAEPVPEEDYVNVLVNMLDAEGYSDDDDLLKRCSNAFMTWDHAVNSNRYLGPSDEGDNPENHVLDRMIEAFIELSNDDQKRDQTITNFPNRAGQLFDYVEQGIRDKRKEVQGQEDSDDNMFTSKEDDLNSLNAQLHYLQTARTVFGPLMN